MANFNDYVAPGTKRYEMIEAGFQNMPEDNGNWTGCHVGNGIQAGTNMSISACLLSDIRNHAVTEAEMRALTRAEALDIYRTKFWEPIQGDRINSQTIANMTADMKSSAGYNGLKRLQMALNSLGENLPVDGNIGNDTIDAINRQSAKSVAVLNNAYRTQMIEHFNIAAQTGQNSIFLKGWLRLLDKYYPEMSVIAEKAGLPEWLNNKWWLIVAGVLLIVVVILIIYLLTRK